YGNATYRVDIIAHCTSGDTKYSLAIPSYGNATYRVDIIAYCTSGDTIYSLAIPSYGNATYRVDIIAYCTLGIQNTVWPFLVMEMPHTAWISSLTARLGIQNTVWPFLVMEMPHTAWISSLTARWGYKIQFGHSQLWKCHIPRGYHRLLHVGDTKYSLAIPSYGNATYRVDIIAYCTLGIQNTVWPFPVMEMPHTAWISSLTARWGYKIQFGHSQLWKCHIPRGYHRLLHVGDTKYSLAIPSYGNATYRVDIIAYCTSGDTKYSLAIPSYGNATYRVDIIAYCTSGDTKYSLAIPSYGNATYRVDIIAYCTSGDTKYSLAIPSYGNATYRVDIIAYCTSGDTKYSLAIPS
ncbi:hypothetical protein J6590_101504, partial [Homalodisca vitripennis]